MLGEEGEVEGEEGAEAAVAGEAEEGAGGDESEAGEEGPRGTDGGRASGGGAEDGGEGGGEGGAGEVLGEDEEDVGGGAEPDERLLDLLRGRGRRGGRVSMGTGRAARAGGGKTRRRYGRGWQKAAIEVRRVGGGGGARVARVGTGGCGGAGRGGEKGEIGKTRTLNMRGAIRIHGDSEASGPLSSPREKVLIGHVSGSASYTR